MIMVMIKNTKSLKCKEFLDFGIIVIIEDAASVPQGELGQFRHSLASPHINKHP